jgi:hypothetical protein
VSSWVRALLCARGRGCLPRYVDRVAPRGDADLVDYRARFADRYFVDHHHLNGPGGMLFARMLSNEVVAPRLLERGTDPG